MTYSKEYTDYLHSSAWRARRAAKIEQAHHRCEHCKETDRLSVHHLTYERLGNEDPRDLVVLCESCHWVADELRKGNVQLWVKFNAAHTNKRAPVQDKPSVITSHARALINLAQNVFARKDAKLKKRDRLKKGLTYEIISLDSKYSKLGARIGDRVKITKVFDKGATANASHPNYRAVFHVSQLKKSH